MAPDSKYWEKIDDYLHGRLPAKEEADMEQAIQQDAALREEVQQQEKIVKGLRQLRLEALAGQAEAWEAEIQGEKKAAALPKEAPTRKGRVIPMRAWAWAAAAVVAILIAAYFIVSPGANETRQIAVVNAFSLPEVAGNRGMDGLQAFRQGLDAYSKKNFEAAIANLRQVPSADEEYAAAQFLLGLCYFQQRDFERALTHFQTAEQRAAEIKITIGTRPNANKVNLKHVNWYLALSHLVNNNRSEGLSLLRQMQQDPSHPFHDEATDLLRKLK